MTDKKKSLEDIRSAVEEGEGFEVERGLTDDDLEAVSGGECLCKCSATLDCGGGGGGGGRAFDDQ
ncbi:MAG: hypothetical protein SF066_08375 [Thermoanaerobaculia bacterium]|nr:hypothetical protein [Thermoanaerobaculia bacterium]